LNSNWVPRILGRLSLHEIARNGAVVLFYTVLANVPFWVVGESLGLEQKGLFGMEYFFVGLFAPFLPKVLFGLLLFGAVAIDFWSAISDSYFLPPLECIRNLFEVRNLAPSQLGIVGLAVLLSLAIVFIAIKLPLRKASSHGFAPSWSLLAIFVLLLATDFIHLDRSTNRFPNPFHFGRSFDGIRFASNGQCLLLRYSVVRLVRDGRFEEGVTREIQSSHGRGAPLQSATAQLGLTEGRDLARTGGQIPNIVLVLLESWGLESEARIRDALIEPYLAPELLQEYDVRQGTVPFVGPTVSGEGRELCGADLGFHLLDAPEAEFMGCIPHILQQEGFQTIALHGLKGHMFQRSDWYPRIGFREMWFQDQFRAKGVSECPGAFLGTCDAEIAAWIENRLASNSESPAFIYWVTLNSHLPVPIPPRLANPVPCTEIQSLVPETALCSWFQLVTNVHQSVAKIAMAHPPRPTIFIVVGDHAPPFNNSDVREQFSSSVVPYVILLPRNQRSRPATPIRASTSNAGAFAHDSEEQRTISSKSSATARNSNGAARGGMRKTPLRALPTAGSE
jgi:sulfatase-like protein